MDEPCGILMRAGLRQTCGVALPQAGQLAREGEHLRFQLRILRRLPWGAFLCVRDVGEPALRCCVGVLGARSGDDLPTNQLDGLVLGRDGWHGALQS